MPTRKSQNPNLYVKIASIFQNSADEQDSAHMLSEVTGWERKYFYFSKSTLEKCFLTSGEVGGSSWALVPGQGSSLHIEVSCLCGTNKLKADKGWPALKLSPSGSGADFENRSSVCGGQDVTVQCPPQALYFFKSFLYLFIFMSLSTCMYVCCVHSWLEEDIRLPGTGGINDCRPSSRS